MRKTATTLADGRELIYYDEIEAAGPRDDVDGDERDLSPQLLASEIRRDPILDEWVVIASQRQDRTFMPATDQCPLCPTSPTNPTEIPASDYDIVVFENRFPSFASRHDILRGAPPPASELFERRPAKGRCEVVVFTSNHDLSFAQLSEDRARRVVDVWADRTAALSAISGIEQVFPFENCGVEIGITLTHPHGQIYGYPFITPKTAQMIQSSRRYQDETGKGLFSSVLEAESRAGDRIVDSNRSWTAFVPAAARWPIEVHLYPHRQVPDLTHLTGEERDHFSSLYLATLRRMEALYDEPVPYIAGWHQAPVNRDRDIAYLHMEVLSIKRAPDKLKFLAGSESGMAVWINDVTPEQIADSLRAASP